MPSSTYKAISFNKGEVLSEFKLNQVASNMKHFNDMMPKVRYAAHSVTRSDQIRIASGVATFPATKSLTVSKNVNFGGFFSPGCYPNVTTGFISNYFRHAMPTVNGLGQMFPDHRGMAISVGSNPPNSSNKNIVRTCYVSWMAMGW